LARQEKEDAKKSKNKTLSGNTEKTFTRKSETLNGAIELLENTSVLLSFFIDKRPINDVGDDRLLKLDDILDWFLHWVADTITNPKDIFSHQTCDDFRSAIMGIQQLCEVQFSRNHQVIPSTINTDIVENIFCQQRALHNGSNTNPNMNTYSYTINSIILGQKTISKKSNTGNVSGGVAPFTFGVPVPLVRNRKSKVTNTVQ
jgi:hypothetical protein